MRFPTRRHFLHSVAATAMPLGVPLLMPRLGLQLPGQGPSPASPGRIVRSRNPENFETNFAGLSGFITPTDVFYVRSHFPTPKLDLATWKLRVEGAVEKPAEFSLADLKKMSEVKVPLLLECAGNGRVYLDPAVRGVNWQTGAVGVAEWTGIVLTELLNRVRPTASAREVIFVGADSGTMEGAPGAIAFSRGIPIEKCRKAEVMLAYGMNGAELLPRHGYPLRLVVGGWYGMASVKWLNRIILTDKPHQGFWQTLDYSYYERQNGMPSLTPITDGLVKAQIARPGHAEIVPAGKTYRIFGAAWAGEADVTKVEVSADGGKTWGEAKLLDHAVPYCWRLWEIDWNIPKEAQTRTLMARATDSNGRTQPMERDPDRRTYMINHVLPVEVAIR